MTHGIARLTLEANIRHVSDFFWTLWGLQKASNRRLSSLKTRVPFTSTLRAPDANVRILPWRSWQVACHTEIVILVLEANADTLSIYTVLWTTLCQLFVTERGASWDSRRSGKQKAPYRPLLCAQRESAAPDCTLSFTTWAPKCHLIIYRRQSGLCSVCIVNLSRVHRSLVAARCRRSLRFNRQRMSRVVTAGYLCPLLSLSGSSWHQVVVPHANLHRMVVMDITVFMFRTSV